MPLVIRRKDSPEKIVQQRGLELEPAPVMGEKLRASKVGRQCVICNACDFVWKARPGKGRNGFSEMLHQKSGWEMQPDGWQQRSCSAVLLNCSVPAEGGSSIRTSTLPAGVAPGMPWAEQGERLGTTGVVFP